MKLRTALIAIAAVLTLTSGAETQGNNSPEARLRAAMDKETVDGNLKAAIDGYKQVISQRGTSREVVAQALLRLGMAYEKQGDAEARKSYERLVREFGDQPVVVQQAWARMAAGTTVAAGPTLRRICSGECGSRVSPDGRWVLVSSGVVRDLSSSTAARRIVDGAACCTKFSPDSKRIAYGFPVGSGKDGVSVVNVDGSGLRSVIGQGGPLAWSPDGTRLLVARYEKNLARLAWVRVADQTVQALPTTRRNVDAATVSPDGQFVAFNGSADGNSDANVYLMASDGAGETLVSPSPAYQEPVGWSPDGRYLLYGQYGEQVSLWAVPVTNGRVNGPPVQIRRFDSGSSLLGLSATGTLYYRQVSSAGEIYTASMDPASGRVTSVPMVLPTPNPGGPVAWSPDSRRLAILTGAAPQKDLHVFSLDDGRDRLIPTGIKFGNGLCWLPGADAVLANIQTPGDLRERRPTRFDTVRVDLTTGETQRVFPGAPSFRSSSCTNTLAASSAEPTSVKVRNLQTGAETVLHRITRPTTDYGAAKLSSDGRFVAFLEMLDSATAAVMVVPSAGGPVRELARANAPVQLQPINGHEWSHDSRYVYFFKRTETAAPHRLYRVPVEGGSEEDMGLEASELRGLEIAPDGRKIFFVMGALNRPEIWAMENFLPSGR
jgi:WD40 repeat protein